MAVGLVPCHRPGGSAGPGLEDCPLLVEDAQGGVLDLDGDDLPGVRHADLDPLPDDLYPAAAGHQPFHAGRSGRWGRWWSGGSGAL